MKKSTFSIRRLTGDNPQSIQKITWINQLANSKRIVHNEGHTLFIFNHLLFSVCLCQWTDEWTHWIESNIEWDNERQTECFRFGSDPSIDCYSHWNAFTGRFFHNQTVPMSQSKPSRQRSRQKRWFANRPPSAQHMKRNVWTEYFHWLPHALSKIDDHHIALCASAIVHENVRIIQLWVRVEFLIDAACRFGLKTESVRSYIERCVPFAVKEPIGSGESASGWSWARIDQVCAVEHPAGWTVLHDQGPMDLHRRRSLLLAATATRKAVSSRPHILHQLFHLQLFRYPRESAGQCDFELWIMTPPYRNGQTINKMFSIRSN